MKNPARLLGLTNGYLLLLAKNPNAAVLQLVFGFAVDLRCIDVALVNAKKNKRRVATHLSTVLQSVVTGSRVFFLPKILQVILLPATLSLHSVTPVILF